MIQLEKMMMEYVGAVVPGSDDGSKGNRDQFQKTVDGQVEVDVCGDLAAQVRYTKVPKIAGKPTSRKRCNSSPKMAGKRLRMLFTSK